MSDQIEYDDCPRVVTTEQLRELNAVAVANGFQNVIPQVALDELAPNAHHVGYVEKSVSSGPDSGAWLINWAVMVEGVPTPMYGQSDVLPETFMQLPSCEEALTSLMDDAISEIISGARETASV